MKILMALFLMLAVGSPAAACFKGVCMGDPLKNVTEFERRDFEFGYEYRTLENGSFDHLLIAGTREGGACAVSAIDTTDEDGSIHHYWGLHERLQKMHGNPDPELPIISGVPGGLAQHRWTLKSNPDGIKSIFISATSRSVRIPPRPGDTHAVSIKYTFKNYEDCEMVRSREWGKRKKLMEDPGWIR